MGFPVDKLRSTLTRLHLIRPAQAVDRFFRRLMGSVLLLARYLLRFPVLRPWVKFLLDRVDRGDRLHFEESEVIRVSDLLQREGLSFWIAGGWGVDILVGCETRRHGDLDIVLDGFHDNKSRVAQLLAGLGYQRLRPLGGTIWFPDAEVFEDGRGHLIEVLNVNWTLLAAAGSLLGPESASGPGPASTSSDLEDLLIERCTTTGQLADVSLPVLTAAAQQLFHHGYQRRAADSHAENILGLIALRDAGTDDIYVPTAPPTNHPASTLLLIPLFCLPPELWRLCRLYRNNIDLIPPHVTVAFPFLPLESVTPDVVRRLTNLLDEVSAFDFELSRVKWFGTNVVYLEPSEADRFRSITKALQAEFPDFLPYGGEFDTIIPHVTLSEHGTLFERRALGRAAPRFLPLAARAAHVWLMTNPAGVDDWAIAKVFMLHHEPS
jgi:hypothetical protein